MHAEGQGQEDRGTGRWRSGSDVRLRLRRDSGADARADHVCASSRDGSSPGLRKSGKVSWLRPDAKSQVSVLYEDGKPAAITNVVVSTQHSADVDHPEIEKFVIEKVIKKVLPKESSDSEDGVPHQSDRALRDWGTARRQRPHRDARSSSILTAGWDVMAAARFRARIPPRLIAAPLTWAAMWPRMSWQQVWPRNAKCSSPTQSGIPSR